ncbi:MAG: NAD(P)-dependent oxidoreductase [Candidatus Binataceae bacterium]|jgi:nucleoside-diphosphate-sugar epimerase
MKVLVTGAGAQIGGLLAIRLVSLGYQVVALGHRTPPLKELIGAAECVRADVAESLLHLPPVDAIIHAAARTPVTWDGTASDYARSNILGMERLIEYARRVAVKYLLNLSTISVYGQFPGGELTEEAPFYRPDVYGTTKYVAERILAAGASRIPGFSLRLPGVLAPNNFGPWIGKVLRKALDDAPITIYNPQASFNNVIDVEELVRFSDHVLKTRPAGIDAVNWGADRPCAIRDIVGLILEYSSSRSDVTEGVAAKGSFWINTDRLREECGFQPADTRQMVQRYVRMTLGQPVRSELSGR